MLGMASSLADHVRPHAIITIVIKERWGSAATSGEGHDQDQGKDRARYRRFVRHRRSHGGAAPEAGYKVYGTSRRGAQAGKRSFEMLPLDVTSDESVEAAVAKWCGATAGSTCS